MPEADGIGNDMTSEEKGIPQPQAWRNGAFAALRHRNFQLYFGGQLISNIGTWMQTIAQGWLVYQISHSDLTLGLVGFASAIPAVLISPWGGVIVDRIPKRTLLMITQAGAMTLAFILAALTFGGRVQVWHIILLAAGLGVVNAFDAPARQAFVVEMVRREDLPNAIALNSMMINGARVIGPAIGGVLLSVMGAAWCFTVNGLSFLAVLASLGAMRLKPHVGAPAVEPPWKQLRSGIQYVLGQADLLGLLLLALIFSVFGVSYAALLPAFVEQVLKQGALAYGWINTATGIGAVSAAFIVAGRRRGGWRGTWLTTASMAFPLTLILFAFNPYFPLSLILAVGLGVGFMLEFALVNTLLQTRVADAMRGRVMALYTLTFFGFAPFGNLMVGALSEQIGLSPAISLFAGISLLFSLVVLYRIPLLKSLP